MLERNSYKVCGDGTVEVSIQRETAKRLLSLLLLLGPGSSSTSLKDAV